MIPFGATCCGGIALTRHGGAGFEPAPAGATNSSAPATGNTTIPVAHFTIALTSACYSLARAASSHRHCPECPRLVSRTPREFGRKTGPGDEKCLEPDHTAARTGQCGTEPKAMAAGRP